MPRDLVFITGGTGFIGSQTALAALEAGYDVRLSIRKETQMPKLRRLFDNYANKVDFAVIPDLSSVEALETAMNDIRHVIHVASPLPGPSAGNDIRRDFVQPAVDSTLAILNAARGQGSVKNVVLMSSFGALMPIGALAGKKVRVRVNEDTDIPVNLDMPLPGGELGMWLRYQASKILAHQAARDWARNTSGDLRVVSMHPGYVLGRNLVQESAEGISGMNAVLWDAINGKPQAGFVTSCVHVQDVADACVRALTAPLPSPYMEFLLVGPALAWQDVVETARAKSTPTFEVPAESPFGGWVDVDVETTAAEDSLGVCWKSPQDMVGDLVDQQLYFKQTTN